MYNKGRALHTPASTATIKSVATSAHHTNADTTSSNRAEEAATTSNKTLGIGHAQVSAATHHAASCTRDDSAYAGLFSAVAASQSAPHPPSRNTDRQAGSARSSHSTMAARASAVNTTARDDAALLTFPPASSSATAATSSMDPCGCSGEVFDAWLTAWVLSIPPPTARNSGVASADAGSPDAASSSPNTRVRREQNRKLFLQREAALHVAYDQLQAAAEALERHHYNLRHGRNVLSAYYDVLEADIYADSDAEAEERAEVLDSALCGSSPADVRASTERHRHGAHEKSSFHHAMREARREKPLNRYDARQQDAQERLDKVYYVLRRLEQLEGALGDRAHSSQSDEDADKADVAGADTEDGERSPRRGDGAADGTGVSQGFLDARELFRPGAYADDSVVQQARDGEGGSGSGSSSQGKLTGETSRTAENAFDQRRLTPAEMKRRRIESALAQRVGLLKSQLRLPREPTEVVSRVRNELLLAFSARVLALRASSSPRSQAMGSAPAALATHRQSDPVDDAPTLSGAAMLNGCQIETFVEWYIKEIIDPFALSQLLQIVPIEYMVTTTTRLVYGSDANGTLRASRALPDLSHVMLRAVSEGRLDAFAQLATSPSVSYLEGKQDKLSHMVLFYVALLCGQLDVLSQLVGHGFHHSQALLAVLVLSGDWDEDSSTGATTSSASARAAVPMSRARANTRVASGAAPIKAGVQNRARGANTASSFRHHLLNILLEVFGDETMQRRRQEKLYRQRHPDSLAAATASALDVLTDWEGVFDPVDQLTAKDLLRRTAQVLLGEADRSGQGAVSASERQARRRGNDSGYDDDITADDDDDEVDDDDKSEGSRRGSGRRSGASSVGTDATERRTPLTPVSLANGEASSQTGWQSLLHLRLLLRMLSRAWLEVDQLAQHRLDTLMSGLAVDAARGPLAPSPATSTPAETHDVKSQQRLHGAGTHASARSLATPPALPNNIKLYYGPHVLSAVQHHQATGTFSSVPSTSVAVAGPADRVREALAHAVSTPNTLPWLLESRALDAIDVAPLACHLTPAFSTPMLQRVNPWSYRPLRETLRSPLWVCADVPMRCTPPHLHLYMSDDAVEVLEEIWSRRFVNLFRNERASGADGEESEEAGQRMRASSAVAAQSDKLRFLLQMHSFQQQRRRRQRARALAQQSHAQRQSTATDTSLLLEEEEEESAAAAAVEAHRDVATFYYESHVSLEYLVLSHRHNLVLQEAPLTADDGTASATMTPRSARTAAEVANASTTSSAAIGGPAGAQGPTRTPRLTPPNQLVLGWCSAAYRDLANGHEAREAITLGDAPRHRQAARDAEDGDDHSRLRGGTFNSGEEEKGVSGGISIDIVRVRQLPACGVAEGADDDDSTSAPLTEVQFRLLYHQHGRVTPLRRRGRCEDQARHRANEASAASRPPPELLLRTVFRPCVQRTTRSSSGGAAAPRRASRRAHTTTTKTYFPAVLPVAEDDESHAGTEGRQPASKSVAESEVASLTAFVPPTTSRSTLSSARSRPSFFAETLDSVPPTTMGAVTATPRLTHGLPAVVTTQASGGQALFGQHALVIGFVVNVLTGHVQLTINGELLEAELFHVNALPVDATHCADGSSEAQVGHAVLCELYPAATVQVSGSVLDCLEPRSVELERAEAVSSAAAPQAIFRLVFEPSALLARQATMRARRRAAEAAAAAAVTPEERALGSNDPTPPEPVLLDAAYKFNAMLHVLTAVRASPSLSLPPLTSSAAAMAGTRTDAVGTSAITVSSVAAGEARAQDRLLAADVLLQRTLLQAQQMLNQSSHGGLFNAITVVPLRIPRRSADAAREGFAALTQGSAEGGNGAGTAVSSPEMGMSDADATRGSLYGPTYTVLSASERLSPLCFALAARRPEMAYGIATHVLTDFHNSSELAVRQRRLALQAACALGYSRVLQVLLERMPVHEVLEAFGLIVQKDVRQQLRREHRQQGQRATRQYLLNVAQGQEGTSILHDAADGVAEGTTEVVTTQAERSSDTEKDDDEGWRQLPLHARHRYAGAYDHRSMLRDGDKKEGARLSTPSAANASSPVVATVIQAAHLYSSHRREYTPLHVALLGGPHRACVTALLNYLYVHLNFRRRFGAGGGSVAQEASTAGDEASDGATTTTAVQGGGDDKPFALRATHMWFREAINVSTPAGESALLMAIRYGLEDIAERLLRLGADPGCRDRTTTAYGLEIACSNRSNRIASLLLNMDVYQQSPHMVNHAGVATPLCWCALSNTPELIVKLLARGASTTLGLEGSSPLQLAVLFGNEAAAQALLASCISPAEAAAAQAQIKRTAMHTTAASTAHTPWTAGTLAADGLLRLPVPPASAPRSLRLNGHAPATAAAVALTATPDKPHLDVDAADARTQFTALHMACEGGLLAVVHGLLRRHASLTALTKVSCQTPLHVALVFGHEQVAMALLTYGKDQLRRGRVVLDIAAADKNGDTVLHLACRAGCVAAVDYIVTQYSPSEVEKALSHHAQKSLLASADGLSSPPASGTPACSSVDVLAENNSGKTPLLLAIQSGVTSVVELVLAAISDLPHTGEAAESLGGPLVDGTCLALHYALNARMRDVVLLLLSDPRFPVSAAFKDVFLTAYRAAAEQHQTDVPDAERTSQPSGNEAGGDAVARATGAPDVDARLRAQSMKGVLFHHATDKRTADKLEALARATPTQAEASASARWGRAASQVSPRGAAALSIVDGAAGRGSDSHRKKPTSNTATAVTKSQSKAASLQQRRRSSYIRGLLARSVSNALAPMQSVSMLLGGFALPELYAMLSEVAEESVTVGIQSPSAMLYGEMLGGFLLEHHRVVVAPNRIVSFSRDALSAIDDAIAGVYSAGSPSQLHSTTPARHTAAVAPGEHATAPAMPMWFVHKEVVQHALRHAPAFSTEVFRLIRLFGRADGGRRVLDELDALVASHRVDMERAAASNTPGVSKQPPRAGEEGGSGRRRSTGGAADEDPIAHAAEHTQRGVGKHKNALFMETHFTSPVGYTALQLAASLGMAHVVEYLLREFPHLSPLHSPRSALVQAEVRVAKGTSPRLTTSPSLSSTSASAPAPLPSSAAPTMTEVLMSTLTDSSSAVMELSVKLHDSAGSSERKWLYSPFHLAVQSGAPAAVAAILSVMKARYTHGASESILFTVAGAGDTSPPPGEERGSREDETAHASAEPVDAFTDHPWRSTQGTVEQAMARLVDHKEPVWVDALQRTALQWLIASRLAPNLRAAPSSWLRQAQAKAAAELSAHPTRRGVAAHLAALAALNAPQAHTTLTSSLLQEVQLLLRHGARVCGLFDSAGRDAWLLAASLDAGIGRRLGELLMTEERVCGDHSQPSQVEPALPFLATWLSRRHPARARLAPVHGPVCEMLQSRQSLLDAWRAGGYGVERLGAATGYPKATSANVRTANVSEAGAAYDDDAAAEAEELERFGVHGIVFGADDDDKHTAAHASETRSVPLAEADASGVAEGLLGRLDEPHDFDAPWASQGRTEVVSLAAADRARLRFVVHRYFTHLLFALAEHNPDFLVHVFLVRYPQPLTCAVRHPATHDTLLTLILKNAARRLAPSTSPADPKRLRAPSRQGGLTPGNDMLTNKSSTGPVKPPLTPLEPHLLATDNQATTAADGVTDQAGAVLPAPLDASTVPEVKQLVGIAMELLQQFPALQETAHTPCVADLVEAPRHLPEHLTAPPDAPPHPDHGEETALSLAARIGYVPLITAIVCLPDAPRGGERELDADRDNDFHRHHEGGDADGSNDQSWSRHEHLSATASWSTSCSSASATRGDVAVGSGVGNSGRGARREARPSPPSGSLLPASGSFQVVLADAAHYAMVNGDREDEGSSERPPTRSTARREEQLSQSLQDPLVRTRLATGVYYDLEALPTVASILSALALQVDGKARRVEFIRRVFPNLHPLAALHVAIENASAARTFMAPVECKNAFWVAVLYAQFTDHLNALDITAKTWNLLLRDLLPAAPAVPIFLIQRRCPELERSRERQRERQRQWRRNLEAITHGTTTAVAGEAKPTRTRSSQRLLRTGGSWRAAPPSVDNPLVAAEGCEHVPSLLTPLMQNHARPAVRGGSALPAKGGRHGRGGGKTPDTTAATKVRLSNWSSLRRRADIFLQLTGMTIAEAWMTTKSTTTTARTSGEGGAASVRPTLMNTLLLDVLELAVRYDEVSVFQALTQLQMPSAAPPDNLATILASMQSTAATDKRNSTGGGGGGPRKNSAFSGRVSPRASVSGGAGGMREEAPYGSPTRAVRFTLHKKVLQYLDNYSTAVWVSCPTLANAALITTAHANAVLQRMNDALWQELLQERHVDLIAVAAGSRHLLEFLYLSPPSSARLYLSAWRYDRVDARTGLPEGMTFPTTTTNTNTNTTTEPATQAARAHEYLNQTMASLATLTAPVASTNASAAVSPVKRPLTSPTLTTATASPEAEAALSPEAKTTPEPVPHVEPTQSAEPESLEVTQQQREQKARAEDELNFARSCMRVGSSIFAATAARQENANVTWGLGAGSRVVALTAPRQSKTVRFLSETEEAGTELNTASAGEATSSAGLITTTAGRRTSQGTRRSSEGTGGEHPRQHAGKSPALTVGKRMSASGLASSGGGAKRLSVRSDGADAGAAEDTDSPSAAEPPLWFMYLQTDWVMHAALSLHSPHPSQSSMEVLTFLMNLRAPLSVSAVDLFLAAGAKSRAGLLPPTQQAAALHEQQLSVVKGTASSATSPSSLWYATPQNGDTLLHLLVINDQCELAEYYLAAVLYLFSQAQLDEPTLQPGRFTVRETRLRGADGGTHPNRTASHHDDDRDANEADGDNVDEEEEAADGALHATEQPARFLHFVLQRNRHGLTAFDYTHSAGMVQLLQQYGCVPPTYRPNPLTFLRALRAAPPTTHLTATADAAGGLSQTTSLAAADVHGTERLTYGSFFPVPRLLLASDDFLTLHDSVQNSDAISAAAGLRAKSRAARRQHERARLALFQMISANTTVTADGKAVDRSGLPFTGSAVSARGPPLPDAALLRQLMQTQRQTRKAIVPILLDSQISLLHLGLCAADDELVLAHQLQLQQQAQERAAQQSPASGNRGNVLGDDGDGAAGEDDEREIVAMLSDSGKSRRVHRYNALLLPPQLHANTAKTSKPKPDVAREKPSAASVPAGSAAATSARGAAAVSSSAHTTPAPLRVNAHPLTQRNVVEALERRQFVVFPLYLPPPPPPLTEEEKKLLQWRQSRTTGKPSGQKPREGTGAVSGGGGGGGGPGMPAFLKKALVAHNADAEATAVESSQPNEAAMLVALTPMQLAQALGHVNRSAAQLSASSAHPNPQFTSKAVRLPKAGTQRPGSLKASASASTTAAAPTAAATPVGNGFAVLTVPVMSPPPFAMPAEEDVVDSPTVLPSAASLTAPVHVGLRAKMAAQLDVWVRAVRQRTERRAAGKQNAATVAASKHGGGRRAPSTQDRLSDAHDGAAGENGPLLVESIAPVGGVATVEQQQLMKALLRYFASSSMTAQLAKSVGFSIAPNYDITAAGDAVAAVRTLKASATRFAENL